MEATVPGSVRWLKLGRLWIDCFRDGRHFGLGLIYERRKTKWTLTLHLLWWLVKFYN